MSFSEFLESRRANAKALVEALGQDFAYVSVLGADIKTRSIRVDRNSSNIGNGHDTECGFAVKLHNGGVFFEYSLDDIAGDIDALARQIRTAFDMNALGGNTIRVQLLSDEPRKESFCRESDLAKYTEAQRLAFCKELCQGLLDKSEKDV